MTTSWSNIVCKNTKEGAPVFHRPLEEVTATLRTRGKTAQLRATLLGEKKPKTIMSALVSSYRKRESAGNLTASTSFLSVSTALDSTQENQELDDTSLRRKGTSGIMRVRTLNESLSISELRRSMEHRPRQSVGFDTVTIREHARILGCNPSVSAGPPMTIS